MSSLVASAPGVYVREALAEIGKSARLPQFLIPTIALPPAFYGLFALGMGGGSIEIAMRLLATHGVFAAMGPALFGFGASVAAERESGELELKRLSPMPAGAHVVAKLVSTLVFSVLAFGIIYVLAASSGVRLSQAQWALLAGVHVASVIPFALIGLSIGYRLGQKAAIAVANVAFLGMAVLGGLWMPITLLPSFIQSAAWALPSYHLGALGLMVVGEGNMANAWLHAGPLALITIAAGMLVCGEAETMWPACPMSRAIEVRAAQRGGPRVQILAYRDAGHLLFGPPIPRTSRFFNSLDMFGGTVEGNAAARVDGWPRVGAFLVVISVTVHSIPGATPYLLHGSIWNKVHCHRNFLLISQAGGGTV